MLLCVSFSAREGEKKMKTKGDFKRCVRDESEHQRGFFRHQEICEFISI
jgi:hypothetical protein